MGVLVHMHDRFDPTKRTIYKLDRPVTVQRLVRRHKGLRPFTKVYRPGGPVYGKRRVREFARTTVCLVNGAELLRKDWKSTTIGPTDCVAFWSPPAGGGVSPLSILASIAVIAASAWLGPQVAGIWFAAGTAAFAATSAAVSATVAAAGFGLMSLFVRPPTQSAVGTGFNNSTPASSPVYNVAAQGNFARLGQPIPEAFGRNRMFPDFVSSPYVYFDNDDDTNDQYLHQILGLGIGEFDIDEDSFKLGDTPLSSYPGVEYDIIPPGELSDVSVADERWITSTDIAEVELLGSGDGSPWAGPFAANPPETTINVFEVDVAAPRGLWKFNVVSSGIDGSDAVFEIEAQEIDDLGDPVGDPGTWENYGETTWLRQSQDPQRMTIGPLTLPSAGRWQVRLRRTDLEDIDLNAGNQIDWIGLRGRVVGRRKFAGMTCIALKMKAGAALNSAQSRQFNLVATRKLPTWDAEAGAMGTELVATRSACDAFSYIARTSNGGRLRDEQIALAELYANAEDFEAKGWSFDFIFDSSTTVSEALARVARAVVAERVTQGGKLHMVRDAPAVGPVAMFSPRNILPGSFSAQYLMPDSTAPDCLIGTYIDQRVWRPIDVTVAFDDSAQLRPTRLTLHGVGNREQGRAVLWNLARADRYRRRVIGFTTAMEGLAVTFGDAISLSHDVPAYGQTLEVIDVDDTDPNAPIFTLADLPVFPAGVTRYAAVRDSKGHRAGPFIANGVSGHEDQIVLTVPDPGDLPEILIGGDRERTWLQFGAAETYAKQMRVKGVIPRDSMSAEVLVFDDDPRMYAPLPEEPDVPIGVDTPDLTIAITSGDGPNVNLRALADTSDYTGLAAQKVTFTQAVDVEIVTMVRGSWPVGAPIFLELAGTITGANGAAGTGGGGGPGTSSLMQPDGAPGNPGGPGGTALDSSSGPLTITGTGTIRGGKGGGGGGGGGGGAFYETVEGGGEGGSITTGHIVLGGDGGAGNGASGTTGSAEGGVSSGDGGAGGNLAGAYGSAGSAGSPGTAASGGIGNGLGGAGGAGGAGGKAIVGVRPSCR